MSNEAYSNLAKRYPWPAARPLRKNDAFNWTLDGGGREILTDVLQQRPAKLMVEVGSFMGGSALRWLRENRHMRLVCVDPFPDHTADYIRSIKDAPWAASYGPNNLARYADLIARHGMLNVVRNNLWDYRHRVILIQGRLQDKVDELRQLEPEILFLDATKAREEFDILDNLFPGAVLTGNGWSWSDAKGHKPVPVFTSKIATQRGGEIYAKASTFVISEPRFNFTLNPHFRQLLAADGRNTPDPFADVMAAFPAWEGMVPTGYHPDWLGNFGLIETFYANDPAYIDNLKAQSQEPRFVRTRQPDLNNAHYYETGAVLRSVLLARDSFRMMELGAGTGPWTVLAAKAAANRGIRNRLCVAVEAEPTRQEWLAANMLRNGITATEGEPIQAVVFPSHRQDEKVLFPVGVPNFAGHSATTDMSVTEMAVDYSGERSTVPLEPAPVISLRGLLQRHGGVFDLIHMDVQGVEYEVILDARDLIGAQVRTFCIETHSKQLDKDIEALFVELGWSCLLSWGFWEDFEIGGRMIPARGLGGFQNWVNPTLALG